MKKLYTALFSLFSFTKCGTDITIESQEANNDDQMNCEDSSQKQNTVLSENQRQYNTHYQNVTGSSACDSLLFYCKTHADSRCSLIFEQCKKSNNPNSGSL